MKFKNIQQLKKEIEEGGEGIGGAQIQLQTLQEVCKETKKVILNIGAEQSDEHLQGMEIFEIELLKKFQGEEKWQNTNAMYVEKSTIECILL